MNEEKTCGLEAPYPGLRPFEHEEADLFFGRGSQVEPMLAKLESHKFLAVVGSSGSGKSSLVRAGLLPALEQGFLSSGATDWRFLIMRPGGDPYGNLAEAILTTLPGVTETPDDAAFVEDALRGTPRALLQAIDASGWDETTHCLVLVDQFEEIFRFRHHDATREGSFGERELYEERNEATAFVDLLLTTAREARRPVYVLITLRSDFIGDCDAFHGLPEAMNESQFLTSRLTREQLREAIEGPLHLFGASADAGLVTAILNEVGNNPDQLPLMQHALRRTWELARTRPVAPGDGVVLRLEEYREIGGLTRALSRHADEVYEETWRAQRQRVAEVMFRSLATLGPQQQLVRRIATVGEIAGIADAAPETVLEVAREFARPDRSFLRISGGRESNVATRLDISHESILRQWDRLKPWLAEEIESGNTHRRLLDTARRWKNGRAALLRRPELDIELRWRREQQPSELWARRYGGDFALVNQFLSESETTVLREDRKARRSLQMTLGVLLGVVVVISILALLLQRKAKIATELLARAHLGEGRSWLMSAVLKYSEGDLFAAAMLAGRAVGYAGLGRETTPDPKFASTIPLLLTADRAPADEARARQLLADALFRGRGGLPLWRIPAGAGRDSPIASLAVSPDGRIMAVGSFDGSILLWEVGQLTPRAILMGHSQAVSSVAFSPDGRMLASGSWDNTVCLWEMGHTNARTTIPAHRERISSVAFSPDGTRVASGSIDNTIRLWICPEGRLDAVWTNEKPVSCVTFSPDGEKLTTASWDGTVKLWVRNQPKPEVLVQNLGAQLYCVAYSPDGRRIAWGGKDRIVNLWDLQTLERINLGSHRDGVRTLAFSPDGDQLASGGDDGKARIWNLKTKDLEATLAGHLSKVAGLAYFPDGKALATGSEDGTAIVWEAGPGGPTRIFLDEAKEVSSVAFSPDSRILATGIEDNTVKLWEVVSGGLLAVLQGHTDLVTSVAFSRDGTNLVSGSADGSVNLWDARVGRRVDTWNGKQGAVRSVAIHPTDGTIVSGAEDGTILLWGRDKTQPLKSFRGHESNVLSVAISPDGTLLASGSRDRTVRVWRMDQTQPPSVLRGHTKYVNSVAFSPDGHRLASGSRDGTVRLWDLKSMQVLAVFEGHTDEVTSVALSPDGRRIASGSRDLTVRLWMVGHPEAIRVFLGHANDVSSVVFSPNGKWLVSGSWDRAARLWELDSDRKWDLALYYGAGFKWVADQSTWQIKGDPLDVSTPSRVINAPPGSLLDLWANATGDSTNVEAKLRTFLRARNWFAALAVWKSGGFEDPASAYLRRVLVATLAMAAVEDLSKGLPWRADRLAFEAADLCRPGDFDDPAVFLSTLRLAQALADAPEGEGGAAAERRQRCSSLLSALAPPDWHAERKARPGVGTR